MIIFTKFFIFVLLILLCVVNGFMEEGYGPFKATVNSFQMCSGPKRKDCTTYSGRIFNETTIIFDIEVLEDIPNIEGKVMASIDKKSQWKMPMGKKMCDHFFWRPLLEKLVSYKNCVVKKGKYHIDLNVHDLAQKYYGGSFIRGKWSIKAMFYDNLCNFSCTIIEIVLSPK